MRKICVGAFLIKENQLLFGKRSKSKSWAPECWDIVGGKALKNENPFAAMQRETKEELGIEVFQAELLTSFEVKDQDGHKSFDYYIYMITQYEGSPVNASDEHSEIKWFTRKELVDIRLALPEYLSIIDTWYARHIQH